MSEYRVCPHCNEAVSVKVYKAHERLYYNKEDKTWITLVQLNIDPFDGSSTDENIPSSPTSFTLASRSGLSH